MIKNIIFDFGGVLYDIDAERTVRAFGKLTSDLEKYSTLQTKDYGPEITLYESGKITSSEFRKRMRKKMAVDCTDEVFDEAWSEILIAPFDYTKDVIERLSKKYNLALLSNTNEVHVNRFAPQCAEFFKHFKQIHYSYQMGHKKPDPRIFIKTLDLTGFAPGETVFVDDMSENLDAAELFGLYTYHIDKEKNLVEFEKDLKKLVTGVPDESEIL